MSAISLTSISQSVESAPFSPRAQYNELEREAQMCKLATKVAGCVCLPVTWAACASYNAIFVVFSIITPACFECLYPRKYRNPETQAEYACSTAYPCCGVEPRLPPENRCDQILHVFDPFVCLYSRTNETAADYLLPEKQHLWRTLGPIAQNMENCDISSSKWDPPKKELIEYKPDPHRIRIERGCVQSNS